MPSRSSPPRPASPLPERDPDPGQARGRSAPACTRSSRRRRSSSKRLCMTRKGSKARAYLCANAALRRKPRSAFRIGYAPASRNALKEHLAAARHPAGADDRGGLARSQATTSLSPMTASATESSSRSPISAAGSSPSAAARSSPDAQANYLNSPETPLFHKSHVLYNGQAARAASRSNGRGRRRRGLYRRDRLRRRGL